MYKAIHAPASSCEPLRHQCPVNTLVDMCRTNLSEQVITSRIRQNRCEIFAAPMRGPSSHHTQPR
jgi:hypothetical protein